MQKLKTIAAAGAVAAFAGLAAAQPIALVPGAGTGLSGTTVGDAPELAGPIIRDVALPVQVFGAGQVLLYQAVLQDRVVQSALTGELHFYRRLLNTNGSLNGQLSSVQTTGFAGWETDVEWRLDGLGDVGPSRAQRSADGNILAFLFGNPIFAPEETTFFFAATNAEAFDTSGQVAVRLTTGEQVVINGVSRPIVPAPGVLGGLVGAGLLASRRRR